MPILLFLCFIVSVGFVVCGHIRLRKLDRGSAPGPKRNARSGLFLGYVCAGFLAWATVWVSRGLWALGELDGAIGSVHMLVAAEESFVKSHPERGYTCNLSELESSGSIADKTVKRFARTGHRSGYRFQIKGCTNLTDKPNSTYLLIAVPDDYKAARVCADQSQVLRIDEPLCYAK